jgi:hypothetical protein
MNMLQTIDTAASERRRQRERRRAERLDAGGAAIVITRGSGVEAVPCGDVSRSGIRLALATPLALGEAVTIRLGDDQELVGHVAWVDGGDCGIAFERAIEGAAGTRLGAVSDRRRTTLAALRKASAFRAGLAVTVILPDRKHKAVLRWSDDDVASLTMRD